MVTTVKKSGQQMDKKGRSKAMTQEEIDELKQTIPVTTKGNRPFIFVQTVGPVEEVQNCITLIPTKVFTGKQHLTLLASEEYGKMNHADCVNNIEEAKHTALLIMQP